MNQRRTHRGEERRLQILLDAPKVREGRDGQIRTATSREACGGVAQVVGGETGHVQLVLPLIVERAAFAVGEGRGADTGVGSSGEVGR